MGINRLRQFLPMHHVRADGVPPISLGSVCTKVQLVRVMLVVEVILTVVINHPIHIIDEAPSAGIMNLWPQRLAIKIGCAYNAIALNNGTQTGGSRRQAVHCYGGGLALKIRYVHKGPPVRSAVRQVNVKIAHGDSANHNSHAPRWAT